MSARSLPVAIFSFLLSASSFADVAISRIADEGLQGWEEKPFAGHTDYQVVHFDDDVALRADSRASASGLYRERRIDLDQTPWLNWRWRVEKPLPRLDERTRPGDDYAARVYVVVDGGLLFWKTIALSYVWSSSEAKGVAWDNAFAGSNVRMMALRNNQDDAIGQWHSEKRNLRQDLREQFGRDIRYIDAIAIMTDTDNSRGEATAWYAGLFLSTD